MKKALLWGAALFALFALTGCPQGTGSEPPKPFTLTVTGIPSDKIIMGASLLLENNIEKSYATGTDMTRSGTFTFYEPGPDGRLPSTNPFTTPGNYLIALAEVDLNTFQETAVYFYTRNNQREKVSFPTSASLPWSAFVLKED
jgi:hypothetical protein